MSLPYVHYTFYHIFTPFSMGNFDENNGRFILAKCKPTKYYKLPIYILSYWENDSLLK